MPIAMAIWISSSAMATATPSSSGTLPALTPPLPPTPLRPPIPSGSAMLALGQNRPLRMPIAMAILISSSASASATLFSSGTPPPLVPPLPLTPPLPPIPSGSAMLGSSPIQPSRMPTAMAILISSSGSTSVIPSFSGTPLSLAPQLPPTPLPSPIPSGLAMLASPPARPLQMPTVMAI